jgi:hypothetical protein
MAPNGTKLTPFNDGSGYKSVEANDATFSRYWSPRTLLNVAKLTTRSFSNPILADISHAPHLRPMNQPTASSTTPTTAETMPCL